MLEGDCLFVARNASPRCPKNDIRMDKCGHEELICDVNNLSRAQEANAEGDEVALKI